MPFKAPEAPKCPKCGRSVFAAEEKVAGGYKWHKVCFKCNMCNKMLDSTSCAEHDRMLFCKTCYGRKYGPKGVGFGMGAGALSMDTGAQFGNTESVQNGHGTTTSEGNIILAPEGEGCPRCGGYVYHADQVFAKGRAWHNRCFKCKVCQRHLDSRTACDGPDKEVYCTSCYRKLYAIKGYGFGQNGPALFSGDTHDIMDGVPPGFRAADTTSIPATTMDEGCPRCGGKVFHAEQMFSKGKMYHKPCFNCHSCKRPLDSVLCCDAPNGEIYCKGCYAKIFGAKGYGFACGAGFLQCPEAHSVTKDRVNLEAKTTSILGDGGDDTCPRCSGRVFHAEKMLSRHSVFHKSCFNCYECRKPLDSTLCCDSPDGEIFCKLCYGKNFGPKGYGFGGAGSVPALSCSSNVNENVQDRVPMEFLPTHKGSKANDDGKGCLRCGHSVFEAEKLVAAHRSWHKRCFTCFVCNRHLDSVTVNDGPDGEIYCKADYAAKFCSQGYGFGQGAGTLRTDHTGAAPICASSAFMLP